MHRGEDPSLPTPCEMPSSMEQHLVYVHDPFRSNPKHCKHSHHHVIPPVGNLPHLQPLPPLPRRGCRQIPLLHHHEPHLPGSGGDLVVAPEPRQRITALDPLHYLDMLGVVGVVPVSSDPLVGDVEGAGTENPVDLGVDVLELRCMAGGLDGVGTVEGGILERHLEEISADHLADIIQAGFLVVGSSSIDLLDTITGIKRGIKDKEDRFVGEKSDPP